MVGLDTGGGKPVVSGGLGGAGLTIDGDFINHSTQANPPSYVKGFNLGSMMGQLSASLNAQMPSLAGMAGFSLANGLPGVIAIGGSGAEDDGDPDTIINEYSSGGAGIAHFNGSFNNYGTILAMGGTAGSGADSNGGAGYLQHADMLNQGILIALAGSS